MRKRVLVFIGFTILISSCAPVNLSKRIDEDVHLSKENFHQLTGTFSNTSSDTLNRKSTFLTKFEKDTTYNRKTNSIKITPINARSISLNVYENDSLVFTKKMKGRYKKGYFRLHRKWNVHFAVGPLIWVLYEGINYIGLTNENELVVLSSGGSGFAFLIAFPIFAASGNTSAIEYPQIN